MKGTASLDPQWPSHHRQAASLAHELAMPPRVSVVIPTYRRPPTLARCLAALVMQSLPAPAYEIIVCDDGCDAATYDVVAAYAKRFRPRGYRFAYVAATRTQGPAGARNRGWKFARADVVAFTDDDTIPDRHWLERGLSAMRGGATAVAGRIQVPLPPRPTDYEREAAGHAGSGFATANCFVYRPMLEHLGGFDERYTAAWRDDSDLEFSIVGAGGTIARADDALVLHPMRPARWGVSLAQQRKRQFDALLFKNHRRQYCERVTFPLRDYAIVLCGLGALVSWALGAVPVALGVATAWAALTATFLAERLQGTSHASSQVVEMIVTSIAIPPLFLFWRAYGAVKFRVAFL